MNKEDQQNKEAKVEHEKDKKTGDFFCSIKNLKL